MDLFESTWTKRVSGASDRQIELRFEIAFGVPAAAAEIEEIGCRSAAAANYDAQDLSGVIVRDESGSRSHPRWLR
jgi:hypothetical protein